MVKQMPQAMVSSCKLYHGIESLNRMKQLHSDPHPTSSQISGNGSSHISQVKAELSQISRRFQDLPSALSRSQNEVTYIGV